MTVSASPPGSDGGAPVPFVIIHIVQLIAAGEHILGLVIRVVLQIGEHDQLPQSFQRFGKNKLLLEQSELLGLD